MYFHDLKDIPSREIIKGYKGKTIHTGSMTFMYWFVEEGAEMPIHNHFHEQVSHVLKGSFELNVNGQLEVLTPGITAVIPPHIPHGGKALTYCELLDVFLPEREDYK